MFARGSSQAAALQRGATAAPELMHGVGTARVNAVLRQLTALLGAGCTLRRALESIAAQTQHQPTLRMVESMAQQIAGGASLAAAMGRFPRQFPPLYVALVQAAQTGGFLRDVLVRITQYSQKRSQLVEKLRSALVYPAVLSVTAIGSLIVLLVFIVPRFVQVYQMAAQQLPWPTLVLLAVSQVLARYWYLFVAALAAVLLGRGRLIKWLDLQAVLDRLLLKLPLWGTLLIKWNAAQFSRTLGLLIRSGVPMLRALSLAAEVPVNRRLRADVGRLTERVAQGAALAAAMRKSDFFSPAAVEMVSVGEESGRLAEVLDQVAEQDEDSVNRVLALLTTLLEPAIILFMGAVIGFVVIALMLPVLLMSDVLG